MFEVGSEVRELFVSDNAKASDAFVAHKDKWLANLHQLAKLRLANFKGITVTENKQCTYTDSDLFYSYRRDGQTGRLATFIWIE